MLPEQKDSEVVHTRRLNDECQVVRAVMVIRQGRGHFIFTQI